MSLADYVCHKPTVETARLCIRPMTPEDIPALREWMPDRSLYTYWGKGPGRAEKNPELLFAKEARPSKSFDLCGENGVANNAERSLSHLIRRQGMPLL